MDLGKWVEEIKQKGSILVEVGKLRVKKASLEKRISRLHCRIGERVDYLKRLGRDLNDDEILKGLISEIRNVENEIEEIDRKMDALKELKESQQQCGEGEGGSSGDQEVS